MTRNATLEKQHSLTVLYGEKMKKFSDTPVKAMRAYGMSEEDISKVHKEWDSVNYKELVFHYNGQIYQVITSNKRFYMKKSNIRERGIGRLIVKKAKADETEEKLILLINIVKNKKAAEKRILTDYTKFEALEKTITYLAEQNTPVQIDALADKTRHTRSFLLDILDDYTDGNFTDITVREVVKLIDNNGKSYFVYDPEFAMEIESHLSGPRARTFRIGTKRDMFTKGVYEKNRIKGVSYKEFWALAKKYAKTPPLSWSKEEYESAGGA